MSRNRFVQRLMFSAIASTGLVSTGALGASAAWTGTAADGLWVTDGNWNPGAAPGAVNAASTDTATFSLAAGSTVTVDPGRTIQNVTFGNATFTLAGSALNLASGGTILSNGTAQDQRISAPLVLLGDGGAYSVQTDTPGTNRELIISGGISGVAAAGNTTTLTLRGSSTGSNAIATAGIGDGANGGKLALVKSDGGLWILQVASTYSGGTTVNAGTLRTDSSGNTSGNIGAGAMTLTGGTFRMQSTGGATFNNALVADASGGALSFRANGNFSPTAITGTGTFTITADANVTVTTTNFRDFGGTVVAGSGTAMFLRMGTGYVENSLRNATLDVAANAALTRQYGTNNTITTDIGALSGNGSIGGSGAGAGTFVLSVGGKNVASTYSGTIVNGGTKTALTKTGTSTLTLTGVNTYTGNTTVAGGTLALSGTGSIANSPVIDVQPLGTLDVSAVTGGWALGATQALKGNGSITGSVTVNGTLAPGASVGTLTVGTGNATLAGTTEIEVDLTAGAADQFNVASLLTYGGVMNVTFTGADADGAAFDLFNFASFAGAFSQVNYTGLDPALTPTFNASTGELTLTAAVPEPASLSVLGLAAGALLGRRRK